MNTETLDKLYLEWSQFTTAKTRREVYLESTLQNIRHMCQTRTLDEIATFMNAVCAELEQPHPEGR